LKYQLLLFLSAFVLALGFTPLFRKLALKLNALDQGGEGRRNHQGAVPRLGGVAIFLAFVLPLLYLLLNRAGDKFQTEFAAILVGSFMVFVIGVYDDIKGSSVWSRLGVEFAAAFLIYTVGIRITAVADPLGGIMRLGWLSLPVTLLWIVVITNAVNLIDGLDGLAAGTGILIILTIVLLNWGRIDYLLIVSVFPLLGALLGFLVYNFPPASIFMGDSGSLFLGFFLSSFAIAAPSGAPGSKIVWITALAFSLPLLDMAYAVLRRWYRGVPIYTADKDHLHHKLLDKGMAKTKVLLFFYGANLILMLTLILLVKVNLKPLPMFLILLILSLAAFAGFQFLSDLNPADFVRKIFRLFRIFRRRRYYSHLINNFERNVEKKKSLDEVRTHLDKLFQDYGLQAVEIHAEVKSRQALVYNFGNRGSEAEALQFEFPLRKDGVCFGRVILQKKYGGEYLLCSGELADILSKYVCELLLD
jgi:UDP-GlcNAc:undecaprenyl-phosphate GlcNAc-1-phosphate transferase